ncbi:MAG: polyprenyl synthetase family protein [Allosphingosinicella sp.]|uniref:polyprenyl synthetase family protein n=1 Tax=Allosphingosinicella sp. TaxID=2823234 RepID=UPI003931FBAE
MTGSGQAVLTRDRAADAEELQRADMARFRAEVEAALDPQAPYLTELEFSMFANGKKIRPRVMLLAARLVAWTGPLPDKVYKGAASLEMLHVATLIHDDVIDEAPMRRGLPSVSAARGTKIAVLVGDLQFVQALRGFAAAVETESDMALVRRVMDAAFDVCRGELDELDRFLPETSEQRRERYFKTIDRKTAALFRLACQAGIDLAGGRTRDIRRGGFFGRALGRAFQIMDDVRDIVELDAMAGKSAGVDLALGRHSLPLLYAYDRLGPDSPVGRAMRGLGAPEGAALEDTLDMLRDCGAVDAAYADARREAEDALFYLEPFPPSPFRDALRRIARDTVDRPLNR